MSRATFAFGVTLPVCALVVAVAPHATDWPRLPFDAIAIRMLVSAAVLVSVAAPLGGVAVPHPRPLLPAIAISLLISAAITSTLVVFAGGGREAVLAIARSHVTLGAAAVAFGALGALCASIFRNPLDAAAVSLLGALAASFALLAGGPAVADLPARLINGALAASPFVTTMWAADVDILRTELLYRLSPIAHLQFQYPPWSLTSAMYVGFAVICFALSRTRDRATPVVSRRESHEAHARVQ